MQVTSNGYYKGYCEGYSQGSIVYRVCKTHMSVLAGFPGKCYYYQDLSLYQSNPTYPLSASYNSGCRMWFGSHPKFWFVLFTIVPNTTKGFTPHPGVNRGAQTLNPGRKPRALLQPSMKCRMFRHLTSDSCEHAGASSLGPIAYIRGPKYAQRPQSQAPSRLPEFQSLH